MNIIQENTDELNAVLKVKVMATDYLPKVEIALKQYQKKASIPGFRQGKVPTGMIQKMYGKSIMVDEINKLLNDSLYNYLNENKIEVLGNPLPKADSVIDWDTQQEFEFLYDMGLSPKFTVDISPSSKFIYQTIQIDDELINNYVEHSATRHGRVEQVDVSESTDFLIGNFVELDENGEILPGGIFKTSSLFIKKVPDAATAKLLEGLKKEDKVVLEAQKLFETPAALATAIGIDKQAAETLTSKLQFTVASISRLVAAEINQEFFDKIYGPGVITTEEEFRLSIKDELSEEFVNESEYKFYNDVVEHLLDNTSINLPTAFLKRWIVSASETPITPEQVESEFEEYAKKLKWQLIERKISKDNGITVTKEEVTAYTKELILKRFGRVNRETMSDEQLNQAVGEILAKEDEVGKLYEKLHKQKLITLFKTKFTLENKELSYKDFLKMAN